MDFKFIFDVFGKLLSEPDLGSKIRASMRSSSAISNIQSLRPLVAIFVLVFDLGNQKWTVIEDAT